MPKREQWREISLLIIKNTLSGGIGMKIKNRMIGVMTYFSNPCSEFVLFSSDHANHIGLAIGAKYTFYYHEGLADFTGTLIKFAINHDDTTEIYFEVDCCKTGKRRKVLIKDLARIERCCEDE